MGISAGGGTYRIDVDGVSASAAGFECNPSELLRKLDRLQEHMQVFQREMAHYFWSEPYGALGKIEGNEGWYVFRTKVRRQPPIRLGILLGECVGQLRSVLDHFIWQIAVWHCRPKGPPERLGFPIKTNGGKRRYAINKLRGYIPDDWLAVVEALQPQDRGDSPLAVIEGFWNQDKHQTVIPIAMTGTTGFLGLQYRPNPDSGQILNSRERAGVRLEDGTELCRVKILPQGSNPRVDVYFCTALLVEVQGGQSLMTTLDLGLWVAENLVRCLIATLPGGESALQSNDRNRALRGFFNHYTTVVTSYDSEAEAALAGVPVIGTRLRVME